MKIKIKAIPLLTQPGKFTWQVRTSNSKFVTFDDCAGAHEFARKYLKRYYKECAAYSMLCSLSVNLLSVQEAGLYDKLYKTKCKDITKAQYGYLKGIHERQQREW